MCCGDSAVKQGCREKLYSFSLSFLKFNVQLCLTSVFVE